MSDRPKPHACRVCDYRGRRLKLEVIELELTKEEARTIRLAARLKNMSVEKFIRHAVIEYLDYLTEREEAI